MSGNASRMKCKVRAAHWVAAAIALSVGSAANAVTCTGPATDIRLYETGELDVNFGWGYVRLCNMYSDYSYAGETYTPEQCRHIYSIGMTAVGSGQDFAVGFAAGPTTCTQTLPGTNGTPPNYPVLSFFLRKP